MCLITVINRRDSKATYGPIFQNYEQLEYIPCYMHKSSPVPGLENFKDLIFVSLISSVTLATPFKFHTTSRRMMNHLEVFHKSQVILGSLQISKFEREFKLHIGYLPELSKVLK